MPVGTLLGGFAAPRNTREVVRQTLQALGFPRCNKPEPTVIEYGGEPVFFGQRLVLVEYGVEGLTHPETVPPCRRLNRNYSPALGALKDSKAD
jgi:hypothetical protein